MSPVVAVTFMFVAFLTLNEVSPVVDFIESALQSTSTFVLPVVQVVVIFSAVTFASLTVPVVDLTSTFPVAVMSASSIAPVDASQE